MMRKRTALKIAAILGTALAPLPAAPQDDPSAWTVYVLNDNCPDYTWGFNEAQTRRAFADVVRAHLDEMTRTDGERPENQDRYNMAVTQEALCFLEHCPAREEELARRVREGRVYVSPFLCNSLWGFQGAEGFLRTLYPARRLAARWGFPLEAAHHIEEPSLPWGVSTLLAGSGIRWLLNPYYDYDSTFGGLRNPPVFRWEGPDGSRLRVIMDPWLCRKASYAQGAAAIKEGGALAKDWIPRYQKLGAEYPLRAVLASGTHSDINPRSGNQARGFAEGILRHNAEPKGRPRLVNATLPMFCRAADAAGESLPLVRGCFGHSWDVWPVSLAKYAAGMREGERALLAAEALLAAAGRGAPDLQRETRTDRARAEWCLSMLSDHAWNGTDAANKKVNAELRKAWDAELSALASGLQGRGWEAAGLRPDPGAIAVFNPLSVPRADLVRLEWPGPAAVVTDAGKILPSQVVEEDGKAWLLFVSPPVPGFGFARLAVKPGASPAAEGRVRASPGEIESPFYLLKADPKAGGVASLVHKASGRELVRPGRALGRAVYHEGREQPFEDLACDIAAAGPVLARLRLSGTAAGISSTVSVTVYAGIDRVDFDFRVRKPASPGRQRLCHSFPLLDGKAPLRVETPAAVVRPRPQPEGDLLPGADARRMAVQGFVDLAGESAGATLAPLDAFCLLLDAEGVTFEALGNDQNYKEVIQDQNGETEFRFRYALRGRAAGEDPAGAAAFSRAASSPLLARPGRIREGLEAPVGVPPGRAVATCLKPADDGQAGGVILRVWETAGEETPLEVSLPAFRRAVACDLIERDGVPIPVAGGKLALKVRPRGLAAVRLIP